MKGQIKVFQYHFICGVSFLRCCCKDAYISKIYHTLWAHHHHTPLRRSDDVFSKKFWLSWNVQSEKWCGEMHICENVIERLFGCLTYIVFPATHYYMVETWICCYSTETTSMCLSGTPVWLAAPRLHIWRISYHLLFATSIFPSSRQFLPHHHHTIIALLRQYIFRMVWCLSVV